ncbi:hypothetical protein [Phaffia rhodozyma]|uniref:Uncharacterized protein n=1 Tax=Phaffia rhodozyma TaxID=264483 RepID=A0A0F7SW58_PHARH|nr:hypothetical protein [Phaffia rhodozyma]
MTPGRNPPRKESTLSTEHSLIDVNIALLDQILDFFKHTLHTDKQLIFPSRVIPGGTVGKHLRHILDHYNALFQAIPLSRPISIPIRPINYDDRTRETSIESSIPLIRLTVSQLQAQIQSLCSGTTEKETQGSWVDEKVQICVKSDVEGRAGDVLLDSTIGRERWLESSPPSNLDVPSSFGVAPSTLAARHQNQSQHQDQEKDKPSLQTSSRNTKNTTVGIVPSRI